MAGFNWGGALQGVGSLVSGVGDLFASSAQTSALQTEAGGFNTESNFYQEAASLEAENAQLAEAAGNVKIAQQQRQNYEVRSATEEAQAGAGFAMSGSGLDILRENIQQGQLATGLLGIQKSIDVNTYNIQAKSYEAAAEQAQAQAGAAYASASGAGTGGIFGAIGGVVSGIAKFAGMFL